MQLEREGLITEVIELPLDELELELEVEEVEEDDVLLVELEELLDELELLDEDKLLELDDEDELVLELELFPCAPYSKAPMS